MDIRKILPNKLMSGATNYQKVKTAIDILKVIDDYAPDNEFTQKYFAPLKTDLENMISIFYTIDGKSQIAEKSKAVNKYYRAIGRTLKFNYDIAGPEMSADLRDLYDIWQSVGPDCCNHGIEAQVAAQSKYREIMKRPENFSKLDVSPIIKNSFLLFDEDLDELINTTQMEQIAREAKGLKMTTTEACEIAFANLHGPFWYALKFKGMDEPDVYMNVVHGIQGSIDRTNSVVAYRKTVRIKKNLEIAENSNIEV